MSFFDDVTVQAKDFAAAVGEKAREVADSAKTTAAILTEQREINKNYRVIGEWFVNEYEGAAPEAIVDVVEAVKAASQRIAQLRASQEKAEDGIVDAGRVCPRCGEVSDGRFCPMCGAAMASGEEDAADTVETSEVPESTEE